MTEEIKIAEYYKKAAEFAGGAMRLLFCGKINLNFHVTAGQIKGLAGAFGILIYMLSDRCRSLKAIHKTEREGKL